MVKIKKRDSIIKLGIVGLVVLILFGLWANVTDVFINAISAVPFKVPVEIPSQLTRPIPLELYTDFFANCRVWVQGDIVDVQGTKTSIGFKTQTFNPTFTLDVINPKTEQEISSVDSEIRIRCDPGGSQNIFSDPSNTITLTGGTVQYYWTAKDCTDAPACKLTTTKTVTNTVTEQIKPASNVLQDSNGAGITIAKPRVSGNQIDSALTSPAETYFTSASLVVTVKPEFQLNIGSEVSRKETATVSLTAGIGTIKVFNQVVDPPKPISQVVKISKIATDPSPAYADSEIVDLEVRIQLPNWNEAEGSPTITMTRPGGAGAVTVIEKVPITAKRLIDSSTDTYEFFISRLDVPKGTNGLIVTGNWLVKAEHPARSGSDSQGFTILAAQNQQNEDDTVNEQTDQQKEEKKSQAPRGQDPDDSPDGGMTDFLSIGAFIDCLTVATAQGDDPCLTKQAFYPIYGIIGLIVLIALVQGTRR